MRFFDEYKQVRNAVEKHTGGDRDLLEFLILRKISTFILLFFKNSTLSPNFFTTLSIVSSIIAGIFLFYAGKYLMILIGIIFLNISLVFDSFDGAYARYKKKSSEFGAWYDSVSDSMKYIIIFISLTLGLCYKVNFSSQWYIHDLIPLNDHKEIILIMGMWIIGNLYITYIIHISRYTLSFNPGNIVTIKQGRFYIGLGSLLYTIVTVFLLTYQVYWLYVFLSFFLPLLWLIPFYKTYIRSKEQTAKDVDR
jgi:phosphatidylglycerophosphate synthase